MSFQKQGIPSDWRVQTLADLGAKVTSGSRGWAKYYAEHGSLFVRITNLDRSNIHLDLRDSRFVRVDSHEVEARRTRLAPGDLLISITADIGIIGYVDEKTPKPAYINQHIARVRLDPRLVDSRFVAYYLASWEPQRRFIGSTDQGAKAGMNLTTVAALPTLVPPRKEQARIADALADADKLIATLERSIAKKQAIKQGMMQQLLTGRTRLAGFTDEWKSKSLQEDVTLISGQHVLAHNCNTRGLGVPYLTGPSDFPDGRIHQTKFTDKPASMCQTGDILVTVKGSGAGTLVEADGSYCISRQLMAIRTNVWDSRFLFYSLSENSRSVKDAVTGLIPGLSRSDILNQTIPVPSVREQHAIATVLSDIDTDLDALDARLAKARDIKQGMMQQLLTGRTRLPVQEPAA